MSGFVCLFVFCLSRYLVTLIGFFFCRLTLTFHMLCTMLTVSLSLHQIESTPLDAFECFVCDHIFKGSPVLPRPDASHLLCPCNNEIGECEMLEDVAKTVARALEEGTMSDPDRSHLSDLGFDDAPWQV